MSTKFNGVVVEVSGIRTIEGGGTGSSGVGGVISINSSVDISNTLTVQSSVSSPVVSGTFYGDGSYLTGIARDFVPLSGGTMTGDLLIYGALTALSGATFINTTFIDTSALRITNTGNGPALYVEQGIGSGDIATFYDADGIEVLHVGNALNPESAGVVGIKTSNPNKTLTVNGEISASSAMWASTYYGYGSNLTNLNASNIATGTLSTARLPVFNGDITTTLNSTVSTTVIKLQGNPISTATPSNGQILQWNGSAWVPGSIATGGNGGGGLTFFLNQGLSAQSPTTNLPLTAHELGRTGLSAQTIVNSLELSHVNYDLVAGFVSDVLDPDTTAIPAGLWDFNLWLYSDANTNDPLVIQALIYKYNGVNAPTLLSTSDDTIITNGGVFYPLVISCLLTQTPLLTSDRIYVEFRAKANSNNHHVTLGFGGNTPTHVHTTLPSVGGSGLVKVVNGIYQTPAALLVDVDVADNAQIAQSKISGLTTSLAAKVNIAGDTMNGNLSINGTLSASSKLYGTLIDWMTLVRGYTTTPTLCATIAGGDVYSYIYNSSPSNITYYRYIATNGSIDAFYTYFSTGTNTLSGVVATKSIII